MPEPIRAWKRRIEEKDPARAFAVGLLYGPSGSGKSSLIKAGVIPRLAANIRVVYVESTAGGTEASILAALRRECPGLPADCRLDQAAAMIRERTKAQRGLKVLLVIDQFEQWLQSHPDLADGELIRALRQCDGQGLQALLLVRDDFWMAITRFARASRSRSWRGSTRPPPSYSISITPSAYWPSWAELWAGFPRTLTSGRRRSKAGFSSGRS